jgi:hypothetical protein
MLLFVYDTLMPMCQTSGEVSFPAVARARQGAVSRGQGDSPP